MSNKKWGNAKDDKQNQDHQQQQQQQQQQGRDEEDEEFGEFEGFECTGHFEASMAQPLPQALQAGMSAWSTFPDYVPSQRTASSALQPDLLPMQATSNMHSSQMTDSNSSLGEAVSFDLPDVSPQEPQSAPPTSPPPPSAEGPSASVRGHAASSHSPLALPDVSSREDKGRAPLPDVRAGGQHLQGAVARNHRMSSGNPSAASGNSAAELGASQHNGVNGSCPQERLNNSRILNQRLSNDPEDLHQRVHNLEDQLSRCRNHESVPEAVNVEAVVQSALQRQRTEFANEMQDLMSRLLRSNTVSEERFKALLLENNRRQLSAIEERLETLAQRINDGLRASVQKALESTPQGVATSTNVDELLRRVTNDQEKRDAESRAHILSCLESVLANGQQQLKVLLQPPGANKDS